MLDRAVALAAALTACLAAPDGRAQEPATDDDLTAEEMIAVAREEWRTVEPSGCPAAKPGEILVCKPDGEDFSVESSLDEAIREGRALPDGMPRAPYVLGLPECGVEVVCHRIGNPPVRPLMIDLAALPHALTPEEAAHVFRAEDMPPRDGAPEAAVAEAAP
jgi:hypothetical protein